MKPIADFRILATLTHGGILSRMAKKLQTIGPNVGIIIDKPMLDRLGITPETELDLSTDGERLIITPIRAKEDRRRQLAAIQKRILQDHGETFRKLAT